ncbi:hypothetical protein [Nocardioides sp. LS1]|uniref:hypothetical protein n=1 Tax=Nocardioides sp. LS1 TaxID=1027620 RepID=UPI000F617F09|nr:hypothetical protein [Nocardioides sp. LS1]
MVYYLAHVVLILIGAILCAIGSDVAAAIGTGLIATGAAGAVIYVYVARTDGVRYRLESLWTSGVERIYVQRAAQIRQEYDDRLGRAHSQIDIIGFGLKDFRRDYLDKLGTMSSRAHIRILLLDADSAYAAQRDSEEEQTPGVIQSEVAEFLKQYNNRYGSEPGFNTGRLQVRTYKSLPTVNIFRIDDDLFWGPYLSGRASSNTLTVRIRRGTSIFDQLEAHFADIWSRFSEEPSWSHL